MMQFKTRLKPASHLIDMTPIVDVIFLLLIFFIVTSDTLPLKSLPVKAPLLPIDSTALTVQLAIVVDAYEVIYLGSKKMIVELAALKTELERELERYSLLHEGITPTVVLSVDGNVRYDTFLKLFCSVQETHVAIRLAYRPSNGEIDATPTSL